MTVANEADGASTSAPERAAGYPEWLRTIDRTLTVHSNFIVVGNVRDFHLIPAPGPVAALRPLSTVDAIWSCLALSGYQAGLVYYPVDPPRVLPEEEDGNGESVTQHQAALTMIHGALDTAAAESGQSERFDPARRVSLERLGDYLWPIMKDQDRALALIIDYASRLATDPDHLVPAEWEFFRRAEKLSHLALPYRRSGVRTSPLFNPVIWIANRDRDLPSWFAAGNDSVRTVAVPVPDLYERHRLAKILLPSFPGAEKKRESERFDRQAARFAEQTEGMTLRGMVDVRHLAIDRGTSIDQVDDAVTCYRAGVLENPWKRPLLQQRIRLELDEEVNKRNEAKRAAAKAEGRDLAPDELEHKILSERVLGQDRAIRRVLDILIRSTMGLTGAHASGHAGRPRGVAFFAGPTGVGKTELAKAMAELIFGDERACIRFDMSEFSAEHSDARLIGAPPGYTGYDAGGELTNAVRRRPFSLILFDEIDKAHGKILDKFLQILEDGRLTDSIGGTVHFAETILVFTSNKGVYDEGASGLLPDVHPGMPSKELEDHMRTALREHFTAPPPKGLGRPELLNRIGDNIVVFDFIGSDVADQIVDNVIANIIARVRTEQAVDVKLDDGVLGRLHKHATHNLDFGARAIGAALETALVNPLARALFIKRVTPGSEKTVVDLTEDRGEWTVTLA